METIKDIFGEFFKEYKNTLGKKYLTFVVTSADRPKDQKGSPHKIPGNALDFTLRTNGQYSGMNEYHDLFGYMIENWPYRAGIDNTPGDGNVHIHLDLGETNTTKMPFYFVENGGVFLKQIKSLKDYKR